MKTYIAFKSALAFLMFSLFSWTAAAQEDHATLLEKIRPAVGAVTVYNDKDEVVDQVSGFFINKEGHLLTCRHVLRGASRVEVRTREGKVFAVRMVIAEDPDLDLIQLLIDLPEGEIPYLRMTDVSAARGEHVTVLGYQHIVQGMVSCIRKLEESGQNFQFSADSPARATGGPVVNKNGDVIAIATEQEVEDQTLTLAMASRRALAMSPAPATLGDWNARIKGEPAVGAEALFFAGMNLLISEEYARALPLVEEAAQRSPRDVEARLNCGYAKARLQRRHEAMRDYEEAVRIEPGNPHALNNLGAMYDALGRFEEAVGMHQQAIKLKPDYAQAYANLGASYYRLGRYEEAIAADKQAIELLPTLSAAHNNLGMAYHKVGRVEEAVQSLSRAVQLRPDFAEAFNSLGKVNFKLGRDQKATEAFQQAIRIKPDFAEAFNNLGVAQSKFGRHQEAAESFKKAIQLKSDFAEAYYNLGLASAKLGRDQEATEAYQQAMRMKPDFAEAANNLGLAYSRAGRYMDSIQCFRQAISVTPNFAEAHYNLAVSHLILGDGHAAFVEYGELKSLDQNLASQLFNIMNRKYTVDVAAVSMRAEDRSDSSQASRSRAAVERIIEMIHRLVAKEALGRRAADGLIARLQIAGARADTRNAIFKINLLDSFIENVGDLINSQEIPAEEGQALIDETNKIINRLSD